MCKVVKLFVYICIVRIGLEPIGLSWLFKYTQHSAGLTENNKVCTC